MDSELITPSVTTGFKLAGTAASAMFVRANQALNNVSDDNIRKVFNDSAIELKTKYLNVMGSCIGQYSMTNVSEKDIVKKLMCKIIANKNENKPYLDDKIFMNNHVNKKHDNFFNCTIIKISTSVTTFDIINCTFYFFRKY